MTDNTKMHDPFAFREAARNHAMDEYFKARPQLIRTRHEERLFEAGFDRAWQAAQSVPVVGEPVAFGRGDKIVDVGTYKNVPAVFVMPAPIVGVVGERAGDIYSKDSIIAGEFVLTFPTGHQAQAVADALCNATPITQAELDALREEVIKLRKLAYIGEHEFDDCTYKFRLEELAPQVRAKDARIKELETALFEVAHSRNLTATPTQWADHLQRTAKAAIAKERQS